MLKLPQHWSVLTNNSSHKKEFIYALEKKNFPQLFGFLSSSHGLIFSKKTIDLYIEKEEKHDIKIVTKGFNKSLKQLSSGEQKNALLEYFSLQEFDYLILDNVFDSLDTANKERFQTIIKKMSLSASIIQINARKEDILPFISHFSELKENNLVLCEKQNIERTNDYFETTIPKPIRNRNHSYSNIVKFTDVSVSYLETKIINKLSWEIKQGEFWQLTGENGTGKSTLISMITGDNPKAYGQNIILFDMLKGTGETVWDIKSKIGYFTPSMIYNFKGYHTVLQMIISGIRDSIGLYIKPSEVEISKAMEWLHFLKLEHLKSNYFNNISKGHQRLIMLVRAFIKWPHLLILDEPTVDLDNESAYLFSMLLNKYHSESNTAIIYVSHRDEKGISPQKTIQLIRSKNGSVAIFE